MRNRLKILVTLLVLGAGGFAAASIASGGSLTDTGTTGTTATTSTTPSHKVLMCHATHSKKYPYHTISVDVHAVPAHLRRGDTLGACTTGTKAKCVKPVKPVKPDKPAKPDVTAGPATPDNSVKPDKPDKPVKPDKPSDSSTGGKGKH